MKSFGWLVLLFVACTAAYADLDTLWAHQVDLPEVSWALDAATVLQDGSVMTASARSDGGSVDLRRYGLSGELEWSGSVTFPSTYVTLIGMEQYNDGQIALLGMYWNSGQDSGNFVHLKRFSESGAELGDDSYSLQLFDATVGLTSLADNSLALYSYRWDAAGMTAPLLVKFDADGDTVWTRNIGPDAVSAMGRAIRELPDGDLLLGGSVSEVNSNPRGFVMRTTPDGVEVWTRIYNGNTDLGLTINSIDIDASNNIVAGGTDGNFWWFSRPWLIGLNPDGSARWQLVNTEDIDIGVMGVRATSGGGAVFCGTNFPDFGLMQSAIYSVESTGVPALEIGFPAPAQLLGLSNDGPRGGVIYGSIGIENGYNDGLLVRFGPNTIVQGFVRAMGTNEPIEGVRVEMLETDEFTYSDVQGIYYLGVSTSQGTLSLTSPCTQPRVESVSLNEGEQNVHNFSLGIPQYDNPVSSVNLVVTFNMWEQDTLTVYNDGNGILSFSSEAVQMTPTNYNWLFVSPASGEIQPNSSAQIVISVLASSEYPESELFGEARIHHNACPDTVDEIGVYSLALDAPDRPAPVESFAVHPAYPNPFNAQTRVAFDLPQTGRVSAKLYSIQGREVATLAERVYDAGSHEISFNGDNLATGVYLLRISSGPSVATQKLVLLK